MGVPNDLFGLSNLESNMAGVRTGVGGHRDLPGVGGHRDLPDVLGQGLAAAVGGGGGGCSFLGVLGGHGFDFLRGGDSSVPEILKASLD